MQVLSSCSSLSFLTLSLDGFSHDAHAGSKTAADLWEGLHQLTAALSHVVCLDVSECLMQDRNLQVRQDEGSAASAFKVI